MEPLSLIVLLVMGTLAGAINAAVGSGSLLTLPVLMALGIPPGVAVRTNTVGMLFSTIGSVVGYRKEIDQEENVWRSLPFFAATPVLRIAGLAGWAGRLWPLDWRGAGGCATRSQMRMTLFDSRSPAD